MVGCSRQVLYSPKRRWVVTRIDRITESRDLRDEKKSQAINPSAAEDDNTLDILKEMRRENSQLFHEKLALQQQLETARDENKQLGRDLKSCEEELCELREQVRKMSTPSSVRRKP